MNKSKQTMLRLPAQVGKEIERLARAKGLPFATMCKSLICEKIKEIASVTETTTYRTDAVNTHQCGSDDNGK